MLAGFRLGGDGREFVGGRLVGETGLLLLRHVGEALGELGVLVEYADRATGVHLAGAGCTAQQQAGAAAQGALRQRGQRGAVTEVAAALVIIQQFEVAKRQCAFVIGGG